MTNSHSQGGAAGGRERGIALLLLPPRFQDFPRALCTRFGFWPGQTSDLLHPWDLGQLLLSWETFHEIQFSTT